jgi:predicted site-specific integrase-resolvase
MRYVPGRVAAEVLGLCQNTLRKYADAGKIEVIVNASGQRRYNIDSFTGAQGATATVCYCRISSVKQKDDLVRQIEFMREKFPNAEIVHDIGSGLNFKRKGLRSILERAMSGDKLTVVVAHRDRLCRFGLQLVELVIKQNGGELVVLDSSEGSPEKELTSDLLSILHVFSCRMHGLRRYSKQIAKDKTLSKP